MAERIQTPFQPGELLCYLGITSRDESFFYISYAVQLVSRQPERLLLAAQWLFPELGRHYHAGALYVEQSIRAASGAVWREHRQQLEALAGRPLPDPPGAAAFLAILLNGFHSDRAA